MQENIHTLAVVLVSVLVTLGATAESNRYLRLAGYRLKDSLVTTVMYSYTSATKCLAECGSSMDCLGISWNPENFECLFSDTYPIRENLDVLSPWITYGFMRYKVWPVKGEGGHYTMTLAAAAERCAQESGRLASPGEAKAAWSEGFHYCACSWMSDGSNGMVLLAPSASCGSSAGINYCGQTLADGFCTDDL